MEICSFRLVIEGKTVKEIPESSRLGLIERFSANSFALSDTEDNTSGPLNRGVIADLPLLRTFFAIRSKFWELSFREVMDVFVILAYASLAASRTPLQWWLSWLKFTLFCEYKWKKWFLWTIVAVQAAENHRDEWGLAQCLRWGIYTSIPTWTHSQIHQQQQRH